MKLATYVLNLDGSIPDFVIDGGYFPDSRIGESPQDWTLIGVVDDSVESSFETIEELTNYFVSIGGDEWIDVTGQSINVVEQAVYLWNKLPTS